MFLCQLVLIDLFDNDYSYIVFSKIFVNLHFYQITCKRSVLVAFAARVQSATNTDIHVVGFSRLISCTMSYFSAIQTSKFGHFIHTQQNNMLLTFYNAS